jgi:hypothetical protein
VLLPCACCAVSKSNVNDLFLRDCKLSPSYIKKYMEWQVIYYHLQVLFDFIQSITVHVIFYQCSSQLCPLAFHFNITNINIVAPCTASISWAATKIYYSMIHAVFWKISCNIMSLSCHLSCSMSMLRHCASKNKAVDFFLWLEETCKSPVCTASSQYPECACCIFPRRSKSHTAKVNFPQRHVSLDIVGDAICVGAHHVSDRGPYATDRPRKCQI